MTPYHNLQGERYTGERTKEELVRFALDKVAPTTHKVNYDNYIELSTEWEPYSRRPWLIDFCADLHSGNDAECLTVASKRKLAAMLKG